MSSQQIFNNGHVADDFTLEDSFDFGGYYGVSADVSSIPGPDVLPMDMNVLSPAQDDRISASSTSTTAAPGTCYSMAAEPEGTNFWTTIMDPSFAIFPTASFEIMSGGSNFPNGCVHSVYDAGMEFNVQQYNDMLSQTNSLVWPQQAYTAQIATFEHDLPQQLVETYDPAESFAMSSNSIDISPCGQPQGANASNNDDAQAAFSEQSQELRLQTVATQGCREGACTTDVVSVADDQAFGEEGQESGPIVQCLWFGGCPTLLPDAASLVKHMQEHCDRVLDAWPGRCQWPQCQSKATFKTKSTMADHVYNIHMMPLVCTHPGCQYKKPFGKPGMLQRHVQSCHQRKDIACPEAGCHRKFPYNRQDKLKAHAFEAHLRCPRRACNHETRTEGVNLNQLAAHMRIRFDCGCARSMIKHIWDLPFEWQHQRIKHNEVDVDTAKQLLRQLLLGNSGEGTLPRQEIIDGTACTVELVKGLYITLEGGCSHRF